MTDPQHAVLSAMSCSGAMYRCTCWRPSRVHPWVEVSLSGSLPCIVSAEHLCCLWHSLRPAAHCCPVPLRRLGSSCHHMIVVPACTLGMVAIAAVILRGSGSFTCSRLTAGCSVCRARWAGRGCPSHLLGASTLLAWPGRSRQCLCIAGVGHCLWLQRPSRVH